ncbi:Protein of unknown function [Cotesia congregata]|uniref:Uncharacterized protein n=1 Tax=Cotesia congregata TaxID=51543 RepID=A0A8J2ECZ3_COTCN|nr:Protein of unknown function [Cotesia congregata]
MDTWLAWKMLVSSIILIGGSESCSITYNRPLDEVLEPNNRSPWLVLVVDTVEKEYAAMSGKTPQIVLKSVFRSPISQLVVVANWQNKVTTSYDSRSISFFYNPPNLNENQVKPTDWTILILDEPFKLYDKVGVVSLANKNHQWDSEDCLTYRWVPVKQIT